MAHYWQGHLPVAFVFSVPGARERSASRPAAGTTGENLDFALTHLNASLPNLFPSTYRYAYRITNAYSTPIAKSLGDSSSQATDSKVITSDNINRVLHDLDSCHTVILCGLKAQLLENSIRQPSRTVVCGWHTSNQAISRKFNSPETRILSDSIARRQLRVRLWAEDLLRSIHAHNAT